MLAGLVNCESHSFVEPFKDIVIRVRIDIRTKFVILFFKVVRVLFWGGGGGEGEYLRIFYSQRLA